MTFHLLPKVYIQSLKRVRVFPLGGHFTRIQKPLQKPFISAFEGILGGAILNGGLVAAVQSDIVGYTTMTMEAGKWYQVGTPFATLQKEVDINGIFSSGFSEGDKLYIFDSKTGTYASIYRWRTSSSGTGWHTKPMGSEMAKDVLKLGDAVFISKAVDGEVTLAGRVDEIASVPFGSEEGDSWNQVVFPYPSATKLSDMKWEGLSVGDKLYLFDSDANGYTRIYRWRTSASGTGWHTKPMGSEMAEDIIYPGEALFVNKVSRSLGSLKK